MYFCSHLLEPTKFFWRTSFLEDWITCCRDRGKVLEGAAMPSPVADQVKFEELDLHRLFKREVSYGGRFVESCVLQLSLVPRFEWHPSFSLSYLGKMISVATFPLLTSIKRKRGKTVMRNAVIKIYLSANIWFYRLRVVLLWIIRWSVFLARKDGTGRTENQRHS